MSGGLAPPILLSFPTLTGQLSRTPRKNEVSAQLFGFNAGIPMRNACLDAALAELDAVGIRDYQLARGGKHLQLRWTVAGHTLRMLTIALTPSDWRSPQNTRSDLRKLLREDGLLEANGVHPPVKPKPDPWRQRLED